MKRALGAARLGLLSLGCLAVAACNPIMGTGPGDPPRAATFLRVDQASRSAHLVLIAAYPATDYQLNYDGYSYGQLLLTFPVGWTLTVQCENRGTVRNSCSVVKDGRATKPLRVDWSTPDPAGGLAPGTSASFTFQPDTAGPYRIASLTQGHEATGLWMTLRVVPGGAPQIGAG